MHDDGEFAGQHHRGLFLPSLGIAQLLRVAQPLSGPVRMI
jgi:hypothetical protein